MTNLSKWSYIGSRWGLASAMYYDVDKYEITKHITFDIPFCSVPQVWIRDRECLSMSFANPNDGFPYAQITNVTETGFDVRYASYYVRTNSLNQTVNKYIPTTPGSTKIEYTAVGEPNLAGTAGPISGFSPVCTSGSTFTLINFPSGATVNWTHSTNLAYVSGQGTASYRIKASRLTTSGSGWVEAEITAGNCDPVIIRESIWVGRPGVPTTTPSGYPTIDVPLEAYLYIGLANAPGATPTMPTTWWSTGSLEVDNATPSGCTFHAYDTGIGNFYVTTQNTCGTSASGGGTVDVYSGGGEDPPIPLALSIQPNPANNYIDATIIKGDLELDNTVLQIKLFNYLSTPVYIGKSHQKSFRINTSRLPRGLYVLQVIYKGKEYSKQVLIEH